jgi:hypothetical protein
LAIWPNFLSVGALSVSADSPIGSALIDFINAHHFPGQRGKPVFFHADPEKIQRVAIISAAVLETVALAP